MSYRFTTKRKTTNEERSGLYDPDGILPTISVTYRMGCLIVEIARNDNRPEVVRSWACAKPEISEKMGMDFRLGVRAAAGFLAAKYEEGAAALVAAEFCGYSSHDIVQSADEFLSTRD
jgi:hypothetical protein